jgi:hypothetical protein
LIAREYASITIIPACTIVVEIANSAKDLIDKEVNAFSRCPDNSLYMLPSTPQVYEIAATCFLVSNIAVNFAVHSC